MIFHENRLPADDSHEVSYLICYFRKGGKNRRLLKIKGGALRVKTIVKSKILSHQYFCLEKGHLHIFSSGLQSRYYHGSKVREKAKIRNQYN